MKTSNIYDISGYLYKIGGRKGKTKKQIQRKWKYFRFAGTRKAIRENTKVREQTQNLKKLTNEERKQRLKVINEKNNKSKSSI